MEFGISSLYIYGCATRRRLYGQTDFSHLQMNVIILALQVITTKHNGFILERSSCYFRLISLVHRNHLRKWECEALFTKVKRLATGAKCQVYIFVNSPIGFIVARYSWTKNDLPSNIGVSYQRTATWPFLSAEYAGSEMHAPGHFSLIIWKTPWLSEKYHDRQALIAVLFTAFHQNVVSCVSSSPI
jgi:hypothetical protein